MPDETWKPIPAYRLLGIPAGYEASSHGRIRSVDRILASGRPAGGVVLKLQADKDGYPTVKLGRTRVRVPRVVQLAFAGPPEVLHVNDDRQDCRPSNLRWGSRVENEQMKGEKGKEIRDGMEWVPPSRIGTPGTAELH
jgi:hypothetical protein